MITKIISGGQVGADIAALRAAKSNGIPTGGWMPKGWWTKDGLRPIYAEQFNMVECERPGYAARTFMNVLDSDGTIRFAYDFKSRGELCTMRAIRTYMKTHWDVHIVRAEYGSHLKHYVPNRGQVLTEVVDWIRGQRIKTLNVAGNADWEIEHLVESFLTEVINVDAQLPAH